MSEEAKPQTDDNNQKIDCHGAFITIHVDGLHEIRNKERQTRGFSEYTPFTVYWKWLKSQFEVKNIYDSAREHYGYNAVTKYDEHTYLIENPLAYAALKGEAGTHHWKVKSLANSQTYDFEVLIEVVPLIDVDESNWYNNADIDCSVFYTYYPGGGKIAKTLSGGCVKHQQSGISARATETRGQLENRIYATKLLLSRLFAHEQGTLHNNELVRTVDIANSIIRNERTGYVSKDIKSFLAGNISPEM